MSKYIKEMVTFLLIEASTNYTRNIADIRAHNNILDLQERQRTLSNTKISNTFNAFRFCLIFAALSVNGSLRLYACANDHNFYFG